MKHPKVTLFIKILCGSVFCIFFKRICHNMANMEFICFNGKTPEESTEPEKEKLTETRKEESTETNTKSVNEVEKIAENKVRERQNKEASSSDLHKSYVVIDKKKKETDNGENNDENNDDKEKNDDLNACSFYMLGEWLQKNQ